MLVHICCSVDSHYFLSELKKKYPDEDFVGFFYNPNIHPKSEYDLRLSDVQRSCDMLGIRLIEGAYNDRHWFVGVRGMENEPEKGKRCLKCFDIRLTESAKKAQELGEQKFTTTLLSSPMKEQEILYKQGDQIGMQMGLDFIKVNVRSNGGVQRQNELAKQDNLYRQNYCGCTFALSQQRQKQNRLSLEMISDIGGRKLPGSIEERQEIFALRDMLEKNNQHYILTQRKKITWRLLSGKISQNGNVIPSYILAHSDSKDCKSGQIFWGYTQIATQTFHNATHNTTSQNPPLCQKLLIGISKKDDSVYLTLDSLNTLAQTSYKDIVDMLYNPLSYECELHIRKIICGDESINPIIIIENPIYDNVKITIQSVFQEEKIFQVVDFVDFNQR